MFCPSNPFASCEDDTDEEGGVGWAPSQIISSSANLGEAPAETVARPTAGAPCRSARAVPVETSTRARGLPATGKRKYPSGCRAQGSLQWAVAVPDSKKIPSLFVVGKKLADSQGGKKQATLGPKTAQKQLVDEAVPVCVPLWPLYTVAVDALGGNRGDINGRTWVHFCHREQWCQTLRAAVGLPGRGNGLGSEIEASQKLFKQAIKDARRPQRDASDGSAMLIDSDDEDHGQDSSDDQDSRRIPHRMTFRKAPVLHITVKNVPLCAMNTLRPLVFEMTESAIQFLKQVVLQELETKALSHSGSQPVTPVKISPFHFDADTLNDTTRVCWHPTTRSYKLILKGRGAAQLSDSTDLAGEPLVVDGTLKGDAFLTAKAAVYRRACEAWNARDASTKARITTSANSEDSQESPNRGSDTSAGSQPVDLS